MQGARRSTPSRKRLNRGEPSGMSGAPDNPMRIAGLRARQPAPTAAYCQPITS